jgi:hypothetical protein
MSFNKVNNKRTFSKFSQPEEKKFCKVCRDAGKSEKEYTSHFTNSVPGSKGITVCPTILSTECSFCHQRGHWASEVYCPALKEKKRNQLQEQQAYANRKNYLAAAAAAAVPEKRIKKMDEFPMLVSSNNIDVKWRKQNLTVSYASMVQKEVVRRSENESESETNFRVLTLNRAGTVKEPKIFQDAISKARVGNFDLELADAEEEYEQEYDQDYDSDNESNYRGWHFIGKTKC